MKELVGHCKLCQKELYCMDGFFHAEMSDTGELYCLTCFNKIKKESDRE